MIGILRERGPSLYLYPMDTGPGSLRVPTDEDDETTTEKEKHLPVSGFYKPWLLKKRISAAEKCQK